MIELFTMTQKKSIQQVILHRIYMLLSLGCDEIFSSLLVTQEDVKQHILW